MTNTEVLVDGIIFPESPRWYDGQLWFVDMFDHKVITADMAGNRTTRGEYNDRPSGIGFLPDGSGIVALMASKRIVYIDTGDIYADLSALGGQCLNDMVVDGKGRAFVDHLTLPLSHSSEPADEGDAIILVEPDGRFKIAAQGGLYRPNGLVIAPDGRTLIAAMGPAHYLAAFTIADDGSLTDARVYAHMGDEGLDGICLDAEGAVWVASPRTGHFLRVLPGGEVSRIISVHEKWAIACMLGGRDRKTLFMATADVPNPARVGPDGYPRESHGFIEIAEVEVAGAGLP